jgi:hypothetical protein
VTPGRSEPTHEYTGPTTIWGLSSKSRGWLRGTKSGLKIFRRESDLRHFLVPKNQVKAL